MLQVSFHFLQELKMQFPDNDKHRILDGKGLAATLRGEIAADVQKLKQKGIHPGLAVILIGDDPASVSYVTAKERACAETGIKSTLIRLPPSTPEDTLLKQIRSLNNDPATHGILVQLPLPSSIREAEVLRTVDPEKDVDGFHPVNVGKLILGEDTFIPCTPHGIVTLLARSKIVTRGKHVVVVGRSNIVGKPVANLLFQKKPDADATVTVCHTGTGDLAQFTRQADILIVAAGRPATVTADMVREGVVLIDVGVNRVPDASRKSGYRLVGDADFDGIFPKAAAITPVPGGVGPLTIAMLLANTIKAARTQNAK